MPQKPGNLILIPDVLGPGPDKKVRVSDHPRIQTQLSFQVSFGFAATPEQLQRFKLELSAVYFLRRHLTLVG